MYGEGITVRDNLAVMISGCSFSRDLKELRQNRKHVRGLTD